MNSQPQRSAGLFSCYTLHIPRLAIRWRLIATIVSLSLVLAPPTPAQTKSARIVRKQAASSTPTPEDEAQLYRNPTFGFRYRIPYGWVDRTKEMQKGNEAGKSVVLQAVFERPPEATGDTVNSAAVIASEDAASYPGLKKTEDYLGPLTELATSKGFQVEGEPYELEVESRQLLRADFIKPLKDKLTMRQCTLVLLTQGKIVSFTFIAGSEDELDELMDGLHFDQRKAPSR